MDDRESPEPEPEAKPLPPVFAARAGPSAIFLPRRTTSSSSISHLLLLALQHTKTSPAHYAPIELLT